MNGAIITRLLATVGFSLLASELCAGDQALREQLFRDFCAGRSVAQSQAALEASDMFAPPTIFEAAGARYVTYQLRDGSAASVAVVTDSGTGIQCSVGVNNIGITLFEDGRVEK